MKNHGRHEGGMGNKYPPTKHRVTRCAGCPCGALATVQPGFIRVITLLGQGVAGNVPPTPRKRPPPGRLWGGF